MQLIQWRRFPILMHLSTQGWDFRPGVDRFCTLSTLGWEILRPISRPGILGYTPQSFIFVTVRLVNLLYTKRTPEFLEGCTSQLSFSCFPLCPRLSVCQDHQVSCSYMDTNSGSSPTLSRATGTNRASSVVQWCYSTSPQLKDTMVCTTYDGWREL